MARGIFRRKLSTQYVAVSNGLLFYSKTSESIKKLGYNLCTRNKSLDVAYNIALIIFSS